MRSLSRPRRPSRGPSDRVPKRTAQLETAPQPSGTKWGTFARYAGVFVAGVALAAVGFLAPRWLKPAATKPTYGLVTPKIDYERPWRAGAVPTSHYDLLKMSPAELADVDFALMNLLCAKGLPGAESMDIPAILKKLDEWAAKVAFETERHLYRVTDPQYADHYQHSEARLRAEFIVQVLQEDCSVHYNLERVQDPDYRNSQDIFLHGMVNSDNGGTCASMPVMYAAIARRLGYPIKLALAREHVFMRWDDGKERFNIDGAGNGGVDYPTDDFYRTWPHPLTEKMLASGEFLNSLTPEEELSMFLELRGICLQEHGRFPEAVETYAAAHRLKPKAVTPMMALASAAEGRPVPKREKDQLADDYLDVVNMQRDAVARFKRAAASGDPTPPMPGAGGAPVAPQPPQPGKPASSPPGQSGGGKKP